jgi:hypothetical protein
MKDLKEEIREVLSKIQIGEDCKGKPYYFGSEGAIEMDLALDLLIPFIEQNYVPREFLNWMGRVGISYVTHSYNDKNKGKYQRVILKEDNEFEITQYTLDELLNYWKQNIKKCQE